MKKLMALILFCLPLQASAEVMHYSKCKINDGKTIADVQTWLNEWRPLAKKNSIEYRVRLLLPHADSQLGANEFFIEGGSPTLQSYAKAWQWWYTDAAALTSNRQPQAAATCDSGACTAAPTERSGLRGAGAGQRRTAVRASPRALASARDPRSMQLGSRR
jgi:hypothetical protein